MYKIYFKGNQMSELTTSESLTLTMSQADLTVIAKSMEMSVNTMQLEFAELEKKAIVLKNDMDRQLAMLSVMKSKLG
jgi:hypothetical protein